MSLTSASGGRGTWVVTLAAFLCGCSTRTQVRDAAAEAGALQSHAAPFEKVQQAVRTVLSGAALSVIEERWIDRSRWSVLAKATLGDLPGRVARVVVEDHWSDCRVWILVQSRPDVPEDAVSEAFQDQLAQALGLEARPGRPLPSSAREMEALYASPLPRCVELTSKACRNLGYRLSFEDSQDGALRTISAEKERSRRLFAALYRQSDQVTRVVIEVRGSSPAENLSEAWAIHEELLIDLQPER